LDEQPDQPQATREPSDLDQAIVWLSVDPRSGQLAFYPRAAAEAIERAWQRREGYVDISAHLPVAATVHLADEPIQQTHKSKGIRSIRRCQLRGSNEVVIEVIRHPEYKTYWAGNGELSSLQESWRRTETAPEDVIVYRTLM